MRLQDRQNPDIEQLAAFRGRLRQAVQKLCELSHADGGRTIAVVAHSAVISAALCECLGLPEAEDVLSLFRTDAGSVTVVSLPSQFETSNHPFSFCLQDDLQPSYSKFKIQ